MSEGQKTGRVSQRVIPPVAVVELGVVEVVGVGVGGGVTVSSQYSVIAPVRSMTLSYTVK